MDSGFVVFDEDKGVLHVASSFEEAREAARWMAKRDGETSIGFDVEQESMASQAMRRVANPDIDPLAQNGLKPLSESTVMSVNLKEQFEHYAHFFPRQGYFDRRGKFVGGKGWDPYQPGANRTLAEVTREGILKQNTKLEKSEIGPPPEVPSIAYGLSLIPSVFAWSGVDSNGESLMQPDLRWVEANSLAQGLQPFDHETGQDKWFNLCPNATSECMRSCLVKTGNNDNVKNYPKLLATYLLQTDPAFFARLLVAALDNYFGEVPRFVTGKGGKKKVHSFWGKRRFVRLNVYSDILWERFLPWLHHRYAGVDGGFYDYTKVPGRIGTTAPNYDLTFSFSGRDDNFDECARLLGSGTGKVAIVLLKSKAEWGNVKKGWGPMWDHPSWLAGFPLVNGDRHDFRPFDPPGVWVALKWKTPKGFVPTKREIREFGPKVKIQDVIKKFIIRADLIDGEWVMAEQPRATAQAERV